MMTIREAKRSGIKQMDRRETRIRMSAEGLEADLEGDKALYNHRLQRDDMRII
jgi:hypothetical protein